MFKPNDKIICIVPPNNSKSHNILVKNYRYTVDDIFCSFHGKRVTLKEFPGILFYTDRFILDDKNNIREKV